MKKCPTCNTPVPEGASWCKLCGEVFDLFARWLRW